MRQLAELLLMVVFRLVNCSMSVMVTWLSIPISNAWLLEGTLTVRTARWDETELLGDEDMLG